MGNSTVAPRNTSLPPPTVSIGDVRPMQTLETVHIQMYSAMAMNGLIIILSIIMIITFHLRPLRSSIPYLILQNVFVLDLITAMTLGPVWSISVGLDNLGVPIPFICRIVGFLHSFMYNAFLLNITVLSFSQFLLYISPDLYGKIFVNCIVTRIFLVTVWAVGGLLSASPLNEDGLWGKYDKFESTCWVKWVTTNDANLSYNLFLTLVTLGPALGFTIFAVVFMMKGHGNSSPNKPSPKPDVILTAAILLMIYIILWLALTVMNSKWNEHWSKVDFRVYLAFIFLFFARGIWNPIVCVAVSAKVRQAFKDVLSCHCTSSRVAPVQEEEVNAQ